MKGFELYLLLFAAGFTSFCARFIAFFAVRKNTPTLKMLQEHMPLIIISALVAFMYRPLDYSHAPYAVDYLLAGLVVILVRRWLKNSVLAIIISTACFVLLHDYLFGLIFKELA